MQIKAHPKADLAAPPKVTARALLIILLYASSQFIFSCEEYDPPPEVTLVQPAEGSFFTGDPISLQFSEPIDPASLQIQVWTNNTDAEKRLLTESGPLLPLCTAAASPCSGPNTLSLSPDNLTATITLDPENLGKPDIPLILQVTDALQDPAGNKRGVDAQFPFVFKPKPDACDDVVAFEDGAYALLGSTTEPVPVALRLLSTIEAQEDGSFVLAGAQSRLKDGADETSTDPADMYIDDTSNGFTIFARGRICARDGIRFLDTDPFTVKLDVSGIGIEMKGVRLTGQVVTNPGTSKDRLDTLLSYGSLTLTIRNRPNEYPAGNAPILADWIEPVSIPAGIPTVCGEVCGVVATNGTCEPPSDFPGEGYCEAQTP